MNTTNKLRSDMAQRFLDALNQGKIPWKACWQGALPCNAATGKLYRGVNALYLSIVADDRGFTDPRWCTYLQAEKNGWQVKKGAVSAKVEYWACYDRKKKKLLSWDDVRTLLASDPAYEKNLQLSCRMYCVFNAEEIEGIPALQRNATDIGTLRQQRDNLIRNMGIGYHEEGSRAYYSPGADAVTLPPEACFDDTYSYMATFLHECGHATGHPSRLNRDLSGIFGSESYAREELRAEIASAFTAQALGLQLSDSQLEYHLSQHIAYVQSWSETLQKNPEELFRAIKAAEAISDYLIEKGEFEMEPKEKSPQLFKAETIQQKKIMEWLVQQGTKAADIVEVELPGPALVRLTNPSGQHINVYCAGNNAVRILDVPDSREEDMQHWFWEETNDPETMEWREDLTPDEAAMVEQWDNRTAQGFSKLAQAILEQQAKKLKETRKYTLEEIPDRPGLRLLFHGPGEIEGYTSPADRPYQAFIDRIREVEIEPGVTAVGRNVLCDFPALEKASWPDTIQKADPLSLQNCPRLKEIEFTGAMLRRMELHGLASPRDMLAMASKYPNMTREQLVEIVAGKQEGLSPEQIAVYAKPEFSSLQMNSIRYSFDTSLTQEQIAFQANPAFDSVQMDIIRASFQAGLSMEQVQIFARPGVSANQMLDAHLAIRDGRTWEPAEESPELQPETEVGVWEADEPDLEP